MRIVFMGTPRFAVPALEALVRRGHEVVAAVTQPDRPAGRGQKPVPPPIKIAAARQGVSVFQPETLRSADTVGALGSLRPELIVVVAYGKILPRSLLDLPPWGCINVHASLLPKYRGAAPVAWAIWRGETRTGVTVMQMNERMDAGPILLQRETEIRAGETCGELEERLALMGAEALVEAIAGLERGELVPRPQEEALATLAPKIEKAHGRIDWSRPADEIERQVRALNPWPSAFTRLGGKFLKVHRVTALPGAYGKTPGSIARTQGALEVACCAGLLRLDEVQLEGRRRLDGAAFARGARLQVGAQLG